MKKLLITALLFLGSFGYADCPDADLNGDCKVTIEDFAIVASEWMSEGIYSEFAYPTESQGKDDRSIHMSAIADGQGPIDGSSENPERGSIAILDLQQEINVPTDPSTGMATGRRVHKPLKVKKYIDKSSPMLLQALVTNENLRTVELKYYRRTADDNLQQYYTIELENARVISYKTEGPNIEMWELVYRKSTWRWYTPEDRTIEYSDDWYEPRS